MRVLESASYKELHAMQTAIEDEMINSPRSKQFDLERLLEAVRTELRLRRRTAGRK